MNGVARLNRYDDDSLRAPAHAIQMQYMLFSQKKE